MAHKPTAEQQLIINSNENLRVNAAAGSGKTATLYHYIKSKPENSRVLYIAFNKSVREEAERRFADIDHVFLHIRTAHSMAFDAIVKKQRYEVTHSSLKPEDVGKLLDIEDFLMCTHIVKLVDYYCGCAEQRVQEVDYLGTLNNQDAFDYVQENYSDIVKNARIILGMMDSHKIPVTHDFYFKKWQLSNPVLNYDYILFDEGQDASATMLDVFNKAKGIKIIVGDTHQQIYSWRNAVNSLEQVSFKELELTNSFRFNQFVADMAIRCIKWKSLLLKNKGVDNYHITGSGKSDKLDSKAVIGRTNTGLLIDAITKIVINKTVLKPYFEGGFYSYSIGNITNMAQDMIHIIDGNSINVTSERLKNISNQDELEKFIDQADDASMKQVLELVLTYGQDLIKHVNDLKNLLVENREEADMIFTTVHKAKGMEYDDVIMLEDFSMKSKLENSLRRADPLFINNILKNINEEINLIYVAITRTRNKIEIPVTIYKDVAKIK